MKFFHLPTSSFFATEKYTKILSVGLQRLLSLLFTKLLLAVRVLLLVNLY